MKNYEKFALRCILREGQNQVIGDDDEECNNQSPFFHDK